MDDSEATIFKLKELASKEPFARLLELEVVKIQPGYARVRMRVDNKKLNIHGITHGGALFALVDEAFEMASNSHGQIAVALNMNITFFASTGAGELLEAEAVEVNRTARTATYQIDVTDTKGKKISTCTALVYRKGQGFPTKKSST